MRNVHFVAGAALAVALAPLARSVQLKLHYDVWGEVGWAGAFFVQSILLAAVYFALGEPKDFWARVSARGRDAGFPWEKLIAVAAPMAYFAVCFTLALTYNDVIATARFDGRADVTLERIDSMLMGGRSVISFAHYAMLHAPWLASLAEIVYLGIFPVGACIVMVGMADGLARAMQLTGTLLLAYYIALLCFFLVPAAGPFVADHSSIWPRGSHVYQLQNGYAVILANLRLGYRPAVTGRDYFIAVPCMHIVQPLIGIWYLRARRGIALLLAGYCALLLPAILLLEEHYVVDVLAALPVAAIAIAVVDSGRTKISEAA